MITPNGGVFGRNPRFQNVTVENNLTVNGDFTLGDDIVVTDTLTVNGLATFNGGLISAKSAISTTNTLIGASAGAALVGGALNNVCIGTNTLSVSQTASSNTAVGSNSLWVNVSGTDNAALGTSALLFNTSTGMTAVGSGAMSSNTTGTANVAVGHQALTSNTTGANTVAVGTSAGRFFGTAAAPSTDVLTAASQSIFIGRDARPSGNSQTNQVVIGDQGRGNGSNTVTIGNSSITATHFAGTATSAVVASGDTVRIVNAKTPATAGAAGTAGDVCWDADYIYVCVAANTWKRAAIATWP